MEYRMLSEGGVTAPKGFRAAGVTAGLKRTGKPDLALIVSDLPATPAGAFTGNLFAAAPVEWDRCVLNRGGQIRAVVVNSGVANACTGAQGAKDAEGMAAYTAEKLGCERMEVLVSSTGRIGVQLPMDVIRHGIDLAAAALSELTGERVTDTVVSEVFSKFCVGK